MLAAFSDGRRFGIAGGDVMYEQIYRLGEYEPLVTHAVRGLLRPGDFAVDIGANHGWFTVVMARAVGPSGDVWAVEPGARMLDALRANLALNDASRVRIVDSALGETDGEVHLHVFRDLPHGHASTATLGRNDFEAHRVPSHTLDGLLRDGSRMPSLIKLDVEGSELGVIRGARQTVASARSTWVIEVNVETAAAFGYEPRSLVESFEEAYDIYRLKREGLVRERDPASAPHGATWLCVPPPHRNRAAALLAQ